MVVLHGQYYLAISILKSLLVSRPGFETGPSTYQQIWANRPRSGCMHAYKTAREGKREVSEERQTRACVTILARKARKSSTYSPCRLIIMKETGTGTEILEMNRDRALS